VNQASEDSEPLLFGLLGSSEMEISASELHDMEWKEHEDEEDVKAELLGMPEDDSELGIMLITITASRRISPSRTVQLEEKDFKIQNAEELDKVDTDFNNIARTELEVINHHHDAQAQK